MDESTESECNFANSTSADGSASNMKVNNTVPPFTYIHYEQHGEDEGASVRDAHTATGEGRETVGTSGGEKTKKGENKKKKDKDKKTDKKRDKESKKSRKTEKIKENSESADVTESDHRKKMERISSVESMDDKVQVFSPPSDSE